MRKHLNDYLFSPLAWVLTIFLVILLLAAVLLLTPFGVKMLANSADAALKELTIKGVSGSILTGLHIDKVAWNDGNSITLNNVDLKIQHYNTVRGRLVAEKIKAGRLTINLKYSESSGEDVTSLPNFGLPLNINAHLIQLDSLQITQNIKDDPGSRDLLFQIKNIKLIKATISDGKLRFRRLVGSPIIMDEPLNINLTEGKLNMNQPHDLKTAGSVTFKHPKIGDLNGNVKLSGTLTNYDFDGVLEHKNEELGEQTIAVLGQGDYKRVHFEKIKLNGDHGTVEAKGRLLWNPEVRWNFLLEGDQLSTKKFLPEWPATVNSTLRYAGSYIDKRLENNIKFDSLEGNLREFPISIQGDIKQREGVLTTNDLVIKLGDNQVKLTGRANEPFNLKWEIDANNIKQVLPKNLSKLKVSGKIKGSGTLKGRLNKPQVKVDLSADGLAYNEFKQGKETLFLKGEMVLDHRVLQLKDLVLKTGRNELHASGQASEPFNLGWNINAENLKQLSPQLAGKIKGTGKLKGSIKKPEINIKLVANNLAFKDIKQGTSSLSLEGDLGLVNDIIHLKNLTAKSGDNRVTVSGQASEPMDLQVRLDAKNLQQVSPDLSGRIRGDAQIKGNYDAPTIKTSLLGSGLRYQEYHFAQKELSVNAELQVADGVPSLKNLVAQIGKNRIKISGRVISPFDIKWDINSKNLAQLVPGLAGGLVSKGQLQGTIEKPIINTTVDGKGLAYKGIKIGSIKAIAQTTNGIYKIQSDISNLQTADQKVKRLKLDVNGSIDNHSIKLYADHEQGKVNLKANGGWLNQHWKGRLQSLAMKGTKAGDWHLQKPTTVNLSQNGFGASKFCLASNKTQMCSTLSWSDKLGLKTKGTLRKTPLSLFKQWLPEGVVLSGSVNGVYDIKQNAGKPVGTINVIFPNSNFSFKNADGEEQILAYKNAELNASINDKTIVAKAKMKILNRGDISASATIKLSPKNGRHTINGKANLDVPNINWAQRYIPHSRGLRGKLKTRITFTGLLSNPQIKGKAELKNAYLRLPEAGTELTKINIKLRADRPGQATIKGQMFMGRGALNINGSFNAKNIARWKAEVKISGNNIRFMNTNEIKATMSPNLTIGITPKVVSILGKVDIPEAFINLKEIPESSVDESEDVYVIGERKPGEQVSAVKIQPRVLVTLGKKVRINAFGLRAKLAGRINVSHNHRDILANGSLKVTDGKYQAYGQNLEINNGSLIFNGSPKIIGMDIRATRKVEKYVVGVHLGGNLLNPKSKIFSDPSLPESEALSFLLTGHSLSTSSGRENALLMSAVRGLGITGNDSLLHSIGSSLGLDDVNIVADKDLKKSKLSLGKRLGPKLYVRYLVELVYGAQKIAIEYKINKRLAVEAQTSADKYGFDFIYEFDRD